MEVYRRDLAKMSRAERNRTLDQMVRVATAHRDKRNWLTHLLDSIRTALQPGRASR